LSNAIKFSPDDSVITLSWRLTDRWAECVVSDEGPGIPADQLERVFDKFRQVGSASTRQHEGAGLGLAISRRLVDAFGGKIWAESEPGAGSRFVVRLRLA
jgi:signal transduction histidine kinase